MSESSERRRSFGFPKMKAFGGKKEDKKTESKTEASALDSTPSALLEAIPDVSDATDSALPLQPPPPQPAVANGVAPGRPKAGFTTAKFLNGGGLQLMDGDGTGFNLRIGPDYKKNGKKAPSAAHVYSPLTIDCFKRSAQKQHVASAVELPQPPGVDTPNTTGLPRRIVVNAIIPADGPPLLGGSNDGSCYQVVVVFGATVETLAAWQSEASPSYKMFDRFVKQAPEGVLPAEGDTDIKERLKLLPRLENMKDLGLPGWIQGYNGKPALITKSGSIYRGDDYIEIGMNTFRFGKVTRMGVHQLMPRFKDFDFHAALTLEGRDNDEMPERTLLSCKIKGLNLLEIASTADLGA